MLLLLAQRLRLAWLLITRVASLRALPMWPIGGGARGASDVTARQDNGTGAELVQLALRCVQFARDTDRTSFGRVSRMPRALPSSAHKDRKVANRR